MNSIADKAVEPIGRYRYGHNYSSKVLNFFVDPSKERLSFFIKVKMNAIGTLNILNEHDFKRWVKDPSGLPGNAYRKDEKSVALSKALGPFLFYQVRSRGIHWKIEFLYREISSKPGGLTARVKEMIALEYFKNLRYRKFYQLLLVHLLIAFEVGR